MAIFEMWDSLSLLAQVFYCVAIPSTLILIIQTISTVIGAGDDGDADGFDDIADSGDLADDATDGVFGSEDVLMDNDGSVFEGLRIFTIRGIVAFLVVFGWVGAILETSGVSLWITIPVSVLSGFTIMVLLALMLKGVMKLRSDGTIDNRNALGVSGKVHLTIPACRSGEGKINLILQGAYVEREAVTDDSTPIPTGSEIVVVGLSGQTTLVVKRK